MTVVFRRTNSLTYLLTCEGPANWVHLTTSHVWQYAPRMHTTRSTTRLPYSTKLYVTEVVQRHLMHMYQHQEQPTTDYLIETPTNTDHEKCHILTTVSPTDPVYHMWIVH